AAGRIGDGDGNAEAAIFCRQGEEGFGRGALVRIVEPREDTPKESGRLAGVVSKMARYDPGVAYGEGAEQQREADERGGSGPSQLVLSRHRTDRRRSTA